MTVEEENAELRAVVKTLWREYKQALKKNLSTPQFIEERQEMVDRVLRRK